MRRGGNHRVVGRVTISVETSFEASSNSGDRERSNRRRRETRNEPRYRLLRRIFDSPCTNHGLNAAVTPRGTVKYTEKGINADERVTRGEREGSFGRCEFWLANFIRSPWRRGTGPLRRRIVNIRPSSTRGEAFRVANGRLIAPLVAKRCLKISSVEEILPERDCSFPRAITELFRVPSWSRGFSFYDHPLPCPVP